MTPELAELQMLVEALDAMLQAFDPNHPGACPGLNSCDEYHGYDLQEAAKHGAWEALTLHKERKTSEEFRLERARVRHEEVEPLVEALKNCRGIAARAARRKGADPDWQHVLRYCSEVGVEGSILRGAPEETTP